METSDERFLALGRSSRSGLVRGGRRKKSAEQARSDASPSDPDKLRLGAELPRRLPLLGRESLTGDDHIQVGEPVHPVACEAESAKGARQ